MSTLPFAASFDALAFIVEQILAGASNPQAAELVPALCFSFSSCSWDDAAGAILERIPYEHYFVGWYRPEELTDAVEVDIYGRRVFVSADTLKRLAGKQLVRRTAGAGGRAKSGSERQLLIAVPRAS